MTIKIDNPEIESFFKNEFKSDIKKFSEFILNNLNNYTQDRTFDVTLLDPNKNSYKLKFDNLDSDADNNSASDKQKKLDQVKGILKNRTHPNMEDPYFYERQKELHKIRADIKNGNMEMLSEEQYEQEIEQFFEHIEK